MGLGLEFTKLYCGGYGGAEFGADVGIDVGMVRVSMVNPLASAETFAAGFLFDDDDEPSLVSTGLEVGVEVGEGFFATGNERPRSLPRLATPTPQVRVVLYPEQSLPCSIHWVQ